MSAIDQYRTRGVSAVVQVVNEVRYEDEVLQRVGVGLPALVDGDATEVREVVGLIHPDYGDVAATVIDGAASSILLHGLGFGPDRNSRIRNLTVRGLDTGGVRMERLCHVVVSPL